MWYSLNLIWPVMITMVWMNYAILRFFSKQPENVISPLFKSCMWRHFRHLWKEQQYIMCCMTEKKINRDGPVWCTNSKNWGHWRAGIFYKSCVYVCVCCVGWAHLWTPFMQLCRNSFCDFQIRVCYLFSKK